MSRDYFYVSIPLVPASDDSKAPSAEPKSANIVKVVNDIPKMDKPLEESIVDLKSDAWQVSLQ